MVRVSSIIALSAACILAVSASPVNHSPKPFSLPVRKSSHGTLKQRVISDHERLTMLSSKTAKPPSIAATNSFIYYTIPISLGTPATTDIEMVFDTSTPFTLIPSFNTSRSSTCHNLHEGAYTPSDVNYADPELYSDILSIGPHSFRQVIGVGGSNNGINVIGFGLSTNDGGDTSGGTPFLSVMDNMVAKNQVPSNVVGIHFKPVWNSTISPVNGEINIGWVDPARYTGNIAYTPLVIEDGFPARWILNIPSVQFGGNTVQTGLTAVVDAGIGMVWLSPALLNSLFGAIRGGKIDTVTGLFTIPLSKAHLLQPITFTIGNNNITWSPSQYMLSAKETALQGLPSNVHYLNIGQKPRWYFDIAFGVSFIEAFYTVLDTTNQRIGFATGK